VLVLNATFEPINVCTVRRAIVLLLKSRAEVLEHGAVTLHSERAAGGPTAPAARSRAGGRRARAHARR